MYKQILVPIDLSDPELAKPAIANAVVMARQTDGTIRLVNVLPLTPVMLAEYVPPDFEVQQRKAAEDAIAIIAKESGLEPARVSTDRSPGRHLSGDPRGGEQHSCRSHRHELASAAAPRRSHLLPRLQCRARGALRQVLGAGGAELRTDTSKPIRQGRPLWSPRSWRRGGLPYSVGSPYRHPGGTSHSGSASGR